MLTILVGNDFAHRAKRLDAVIAPCVKRGAEVEYYSDVSFNAETLRGMAGSTSLFGGTFVVVISGIGDLTEKRDEFEKIIPALVDSPHQFILTETTLPAPFLKKATAKEATVEEFELKNKPKKIEAFNTFLLTDAFSDRKRSVAWGLYRQAIELGLEPRELHSKIFWAVKSMLIAKHAATPEASGLNPFVYAKAKRASSNFHAGELEKIATELATLFHEALISGINLETAFEAFILRSLEKKTA